MKAKVIFNPYANRWKARTAAPDFLDALTRAGIDHDLHRTEAPGEAIQVAAAAARQGYGCVIAVGGDGTVSETVNGLLRAAGDGETLPLGILPVGSGNDFSDMAGVPRESEEVAQMIRAGRTRQVDVAQVNERYFDNNCAVAMEPLVSVEHEKMTRFHGNLRYGVAVLRALIKLRAWEMSIEWDGGGYEGPTFLFSICNGPRIGSMFRMAPEARIDDGLLDFVLVPEVSKRTVLAILPRLLKGSHVAHPRVTTGRSREFHITSRPTTPLHADGEILSEAISEITCRVLPGKLTLFATEAGDRTAAASPTAPA